MWRLTLRTKILLTVCVVMVGLGALTAYGVSYQSRIMMVEVRRLGIEHAGVELARTTRTHFERGSKIAQVIADRDETLSLIASGGAELRDRSDRLGGVLSQYLVDNPEYQTIYLLDRTGQCTWSTDERLLGRTFAGREYAQYAIRGSAFAQSVIGPEGEELAYYFAHPVKDDTGEVIGVAVVKMSSLYVGDLMRESELYKVSGILLTDSDGIILFASDENLILKSLGSLQEGEQTRIISGRRYGETSIKSSGYESLQSAVRAYEGPVSLDVASPIDKSDEVVSIIRLDPYPFYLITKVPSHSLVGSATVLGWLVAGGILLGIVLTIVMITILVSNILRPIARISAFARSVGEGDLSRTVQVSGDDELHDMAQALNSMTKRLHDKNTDLERKVEQQAGDLMEKGSALERVQRDITTLKEELENKRKLSEAQAREMIKYQLAIENVSDHIIITDPDGKVIFANRAIERITGYAREEVLGTKAGVKWGGLMGSEYYANLWDTIKNKRETFESDINNKRKSGEQYIAELKIAPILDDQGKVIFFVGIERDVTRIREVERIKTEFISLASHQLRTPLAGMKWFLEMLLNGDLGAITDEQRNVIKNINESNERMIGLINALLNVSRMESGRVILKVEPTNIQDTVKSLIVDVTAALEKRHQTLLVDIPSDLPLMQLDGKLIREVYMNFLTNAIKYSPEGKTITIKLTRKNDMLLSEIKDQGYGIPVADQEKIFQKFFRASATAKNDTEGNGLGLYLTKSIIESSGGSVWFKSVEGRGTSFFFTLPIRE